MDLEVVIEGVSDVQVSKEITRKIRQVCKDAECSGQWSVLMSPSETRGQWDLAARGPFGHHVVSFAERAHQLPELVAEQLLTCLERSAGSVGNFAVADRTTANPVDRDADV